MGMMAMTMAMVPIWAVQCMEATVMAVEPEPIMAETFMEVMVTVAVTEMAAVMETTAEMVGMTVMTMVMIATVVMITTVVMIMTVETVIINHQIINQINQIIKHVTDAIKIMTTTSIPLSVSVTFTP